MTVLTSWNDVPAVEGILYDIHWCQYKLYVFKNKLLLQVLYDALFHSTV